MWELLTVNISERGVWRSILRSRNILALWILRTLPNIFGSSQRVHEVSPAGAADPLEVHVAHDLRVSARHGGGRILASWLGGFPIGGPCTPLATQDDKMREVNKRVEADDDIEETSNSGTFRGGQPPSEARRHICVEYDFFISLVLFLFSCARKRQECFAVFASR